MKRETLEALKDILIDMSARLRGDIRSLEDLSRVPTGGNAGGDLSNTPMHLADLGTSAYLQELNATLLENQEYIREEVLAALQRVEAGTYGTCENCGMEIISERLELLPYTRYCTPCAELLEAGKPVNLNTGRPHSGDDTLDPRDDEDADEPYALADEEPSSSDQESDAIGSRHPGDIHAAGTAGGGTAIGGLAGTNLGSGEPSSDDLEEAMGSSQFDVAIEADEVQDTAYSGPAGGAVGGTPAGKRAVGGKARRGIETRSDSDDGSSGR